jgi:rhodanese-related sulfurtransferase
MENEMLPEDLEILVKNGEPLLLIDVRSPEVYADRHLEGAINIPLDQLKTVASFLDKEKFYITVCGKGG